MTVASDSVNPREGLSPKGEAEVVNRNNNETEPISVEEESPDPQPPDNDDSGDSASGKKV